MATASNTLEQFQNINISAYRVLFILLVLVRYRSLNLLELNRLLYENAMIGRGYNSDTLTKYINTLRELGCRIPRSTNRNDYSYELLKSPFPLTLEPAEVLVAKKLLAVLERQSDESLCQDYRAFLNALCWATGCREMCPDEAWSLDEELIEPGWAARRERLAEYKGYCQDAFTLDVSWRRADGTLATCLFEPYEVVERGAQLCLLGQDRGSQEQFLLDIQSIVFVSQLPVKNRRPPVQIMVTFSLYGRLAKSYRLYPGEKIVYRSDKELQVKARVTETSTLMQRLLKYGKSCQVLGPESLREGMRNQIAARLETLLAHSSGQAEL